MARSTTDLVYNVTGQTFELRVQAGRPASATFKVLDDFAGDDDTADFSGSATVDTVSTTVDVASGVSSTDPQKLSIAATAGIVTTRKYLLSEGSKSEWVQPIEIVSADYIRCRHPLKNDYTTAATLVSTTISATVDATWIADLGNISDPIDPNPRYRVRWAVVGTTTPVLYSYLDLVRAPTGCEIDFDDLNARAPGIYDGIPIEYRTEQGRPVIDSAFKAVKAKLAAHGIDSDAFHNDEILDELVTLKALNVVAMGGWKPLAYDSVAQYVADTERLFETFFQQHVSVTLKSRMATGTSGGVSTVVALPFWSK